jgi:hypothetical protein
MRQNETYNVEVTWAGTSPIPGTVGLDGVRKMTSHSLIVFAIPLEPIS